MTWNYEVLRGTFMPLGFNSITAFAVSCQRNQRTRSRMITGIWRLVLRWYSV